MRQRILAALWLAACPAAVFGAPALDTDELARQAGSAFERGDWPGAEKAAMKFLDLAPRSVPRAKVRLLLAECYFRQSRWPQALEALALTEKEAEPDSLLAWSARLRTAEALLRVGKLDKAAGTLAAVARSPFPLLASEARLEQGCLLLRQGKDAEAEQVLQDLLQANPQYRSDPQVGKALGYLLLKTGSAPQANDFVKQTLWQADWGDPRHLLLQAMAYRALGKTQEAVRFFQLVVKHAEDEDWKAEALYQIGDIFLQRKMLSLATQSLDEMLSRFPRAPSRRKALQRLAVIALLDGQPREARAKAERILATAPQGAVEDLLSAQAEYLIGEAAIKERQFQDARVAFEKAAKAPSLAMESRLKLIWLDLRSQDFNLAVRRADEFLKDFSWGPLSGHALLLRGLGFQKAGNLERAAADYVRFLDSYPQSALEEQVIFLLADAYLQSKRWPELVSHISVAAHKLPLRPTEWQAGILFCVAEGYYELGRAAEALTIYRNIARRFPPNRLSPHVFEGLALASGKLEKYEEAFAAQEKALAFSKTFKNREIVRYGLLTLGDLFFNKRRYKSAFACYDAFLQDFSDDPLAPNALYRSASALDRLRRHKDAARRWERVARQFPASPFAAQSLLELGRHYFNAGDHLAAQECLSKLIQLFPQGPEARDATLLLAQNLFNQALYQEALSRYQEFLQKYPDDEQAAEVKKLLETSLYQLALEKNSPDLFLSKYPDSAMAEDLFWDMSVKFWKQKEYAKALDSLQKLVVHFPDREKTKRAMYMMGEIYFREKNFKEASASYQSYVDSKPEDPKLLPRALFRAAVSQFQQGLPEEATQTFSKLVNEHPKDALTKDAYYNLILAQLAAKRPAEALEACKTYLQNYRDEKDHSAVYLQMGHALKELGETKQAAGAYSRVSKRGPFAIEAYYHLAQLYQAQEEYNKARAAYAVLVPLKPRDNDLRISGIAMLAEFYERLGRKADSLRLYREVAKFSKNPEWAEAARQKIAGLKTGTKGGMEQ